MGGLSADHSASPFLRWAGSKRSILGKLESFVPRDYARYIEPFAGSACLFFNMAPKRAVLSDLNRELIDTFIAVRDSPEAVAKAIREIPVGPKEYYRVRAMDLEQLDATRRAARFIYLNRFCFNGLYRTNANGVFNVPYGRPKTYSVPTRDELQKCAARLQSARILAGDFEKVVRKTVRENDFVYLDPPFFRTSRRTFRQYTAKAFDADDLARLGRLLNFIDKTGAYFMVSYALCPEARDAFVSWPTHRISTRRNIGGFADRRRSSLELIVTNVG